jgi:hypothetical protein
VDEQRLDLPERDPLLVAHRERQHLLVGGEGPGGDRAEQPQHREVDLTVGPVGGGIDQPRPPVGGGEDVAAPEVAVDPSRRLLRAAEAIDPGDYGRDRRRRALVDPARIPRIAGQPLDPGTVVLGPRRRRADRTRRQLDATEAERHLGRTRGKDAEARGARGVDPGEPGTELLLPIPAEPPLLDPGENQAPIPVLVDRRQHLRDREPARRLAEPGEAGGLELVLAGAGPGPRLQERFGPVLEPEPPGLVDVAAGHPAGPLHRRAQRPARRPDHRRRPHPSAAIVALSSAIRPSAARSTMSSTSSNPRSPP